MNGKHRNRSGRQVPVKEAATAVSQSGALTFDLRDGGLSIDFSKLDAPERGYDADVAWIEHRPGNVSLFFGKLDRDNPGQFRSRLEVRYPPENFLITFWGQSVEFVVRLRKYVAQWANQTIVNLEPNWRALQSHSEWASYTNLSHSGTAASLDFYDVSPSDLVRLSRTKSLLGIKLRPIVRVQMTTFELSAFLERVSTEVANIQSDIADVHVASKQVPLTLAAAAPEEKREYGS